MYERQLSGLDLKQILQIDGNEFAITDDGNGFVRGKIINMRLGKTDYIIKLGNIILAQQRGIGQFSWWNLPNMTHYICKFTNIPRGFFYPTRDGDIISMIKDAILRHLY